MYYVQKVTFVYVQTIALHYFDFRFLDSILPLSSSLKAN